MKAGDLDRQIELHFPVYDLGTDEFNATRYKLRGEEVWRKYTAAQYTPVSDRERMASAERAAEITARFRVRWTQGLRTLSPTWSITFEGCSFNIIGVKEIGRRQWLEITACARAEPVARGSEISIGPSQILRST